MAYTKTNWSNGQAPAINETNLNKIEQGIYDATYVDGVKAGTSVDSDYKVNILYSKNLLENKLQSQTINGLTITINNDKSVTISGTASANTSLTLNTTLNKKGTFTLSGCPSGGSDSTYRLYTDYKPIGGTYQFKGDTGSGVTFTINDSLEYINFVIQIFSGTTINKTFYPMLNYGSTADIYEKYIIPSIVVDGDEIYSQPSDTNWKKISLNSGYTGELYVRKIENIVSVIGLNISGSFTGGTSFATIPEGFRPSMQINYVGRNTANENLLIINQNSVGAIRTGNNISNGVLQFSSTYMIN